MWAYAILKFPNYRIFKLNLMRFFFLFLFLFPVVVKGQGYVESIVLFRKNYTEDLLADKRKPITQSQVKYMSFFPPDKNYCVWADFTETPGSVPFLVPTHSGKDKPFREYGVLKFVLNGDSLALHVYQLIDLINDAAHKDDLFIPFNDETNYDLSYGGGRYIDLSIKDIKDGKVLLDFNKCYNPYCAYADGFSCPVPPRENRLRTEIRAGEKAFQH
jgi:uncharacterized protein (DUF1684 family)